MDDLIDDALPEVQSALLTGEQLAALLEELLERGEISQLVVRPLCGLSAPTALQPEGDERHRQVLAVGEQLARGEVAGLRIAYRFDQSEWIDTFSRRDGQIRLVRVVCHLPSGR